MCYQIEQGNLLGNKGTQLRKFNFDDLLVALVQALIIHDYSVVARLITGIG